MSSVVVVGAGQCGLRVAARLVKISHVSVVERLPAPGGQEPERPQTDELSTAAGRAGASLLLGTCGVSWDGEALTTLGVDGAAKLAADALVVATGSRPATRGELGIGGDRCAGVLPVSAAVHLTESGVLLGRRPAVVGGGAEAAHCAQLLLAAGADSVTLVAPDGVTATMPVGVQVYTGWSVERVQGAARVDSVILSRGACRERFLADAVVLAVRRVPARNVEGAIFGGPRVVFCHGETDVKSAAGSEAAATAAAAAVHRLIVSRKEP